MQQLIRYTLVGLASNGVAYILYLSLTYYGMGHKTTMTLLYVMGVAQTFYFNRGWTFEHNGKISSALIRYIIEPLAKGALRGGFFAAGGKGGGGGRLLVPLRE